MDRIAAFNECLRHKGLKNTSQRMIILETFLGSKSHYSTEDLYLKLRKDHPKIGYATIHRTLKLFAECGIAIELNFGDGQTRFEPLRANHHHDHLVCTSCGKVIEFTEPQIEDLQAQVAAAHGFVIKRHRHELYGLCSNCAANS
ncbi:MAG: transcriptional repressor [Deltaproteobacteria bacterium]|jgi:Fur family ferric uptake transcriptional regulator|nr:transcriptional repressor [Deltaproteobacteria bacterium]MCW8891981.1 transcriptional repressor [Deltaproteobacteria bacterium]MCW9050682.1 transcriptional repressor [Deltaproteobacteria bacterium]